MAEREREQTTEEQIQELVENRDGRYVLIGTSEGAAEGDAIIFEPATRMVSWFDENDELHRDVVRRMLQAGARVLPRVPPDPPRGLTIRPTTP
jgi:hypothetical protein